MSRCPNPICAAPVREGSRFCPACGLRFEASLPPLARPVLAYQAPDRTAGPSAAMARVLRITLVAGGLACVIAWGMICLLRTPESVVVTGPVIALLGVVLVVCGAIARRFGAVVVGAMHLGICILFVVLVNALDWSPRQAKTPFIAMGAVYLLASLPLTVVAWRGVRRR